MVRCWRWTTNAVLDFTGDRSDHFRMIECDMSSHEAYGMPRELSAAFFGVIAETLRELLDKDWSPEVDVACRGFLAELDRFIADLKQNPTRARSEATEDVRD